MISCQIGTLSKIGQKMRYADIFCQGSDCQFASCFEDELGFCGDFEMFKIGNKSASVDRHQSEERSYCKNYLFLSSESDKRCASLSK